MRRGTPGAERFGSFIHLIRIEKGLSMRQVAENLGPGHFASTISQAEKGQRAVKEDKIDIWAEALGFSKGHLRYEWNASNLLPEPPIIRTRTKTTPKSELENLVRNLNGPERNRVRGYIDALIENRIDSSLHPAGG
jgi:transcriptional regulator with XRE-family HTH domain